MIAFLLASSWLAVAAPAQTPGFPITVENTLDFDRVDEPVASGIPVPYFAGIRYPGYGMQLIDDTGAVVPSQVKTLARWFGTRDDTSKSVKWVLLEFPATVPANSTRTYYIRGGLRGQGQVTVSNRSDVIEVDTGAARFTVDKNDASLFSEVTVAGSRVTGSVQEPVAVRDVFLHAVAPIIDSTVVEEAGSVRSVICRRGRLPDLGLAFTQRYFFWTGQTRARCEFRLENPGNYGELTYLGNTIDHAYFEDLSLSIDLRDADCDVVTSSSPLQTDGDRFVLSQDFDGTHVRQYDWLSSFTCEVELRSQTTLVHDRYDGTLGLNGSQGSASIAVDRFWQNFPKAFEADGSKLEIDLFPAFGNGPEASGQYGFPGQPPTNPLSLDYYRFEGGRWKTHDLTLDFKSAGQVFTPLELTRQAAALNAPMMALAPHDHYFKTFALGDLVMERRAWTDVARQRYERLMDVLVHDGAADSQDTIGRIGLPKFRTRGGTYGDRQMFGWENFGDIAWGDGYSSNHYDLTFGVLVNFFRTGDYDFFDVARDLCAHRRDYDNNHTTDPASSHRGGQMYEKGYFHGNYRFPTPSHTWVHGPLLYYVMTGDEGSYETALELGDFIMRNHPESWDGRWGSRILGWQLEGLTNLWNYIGDTRYASVAQQTMQRWEFHDLANGARGVVPNPNATPPVASTWMHAIVLNALCKYYLNTRDVSALPSIRRLADFMHDEVVEVRPSGPSSSRTLARVYGLADPAVDYYGQSSSHHVWVTTQALSYASICLSDPAYFQMATDLFESITRYHQHTGQQTARDYDDSNTYSDVAFRMATFPNSETKIMSNVALWGQAYMMARALWDGAWFD